MTGVAEILYQGENLRLWRDTKGIAELCFDAASGPVNKFDATTRNELRAAVDILRLDPSTRGLVLSSARETFVVGADINEFLELFQSPGEAFAADLREMHRVFVDIENLPFPSVALINGAALGGGLEVCLACDFRLMASAAVVGLPEIHLGIFPGWGGTIRMPRLVGIDKAVDWIASGRTFDSDTALADGVVDAVADGARLREVALRWLEQGHSDPGLMERRRSKRDPIVTDTMQRDRLFDAIRSRLGKRLDPHYPALGLVVDAMSRHVALSREQAIDVEIDAFLKVCRTPAAASLVRHFLDERFVDKQCRRLVGDVRPPERIGIVGCCSAAISLVRDCVLAGLPVVLVTGCHGDEPGIEHAIIASIDDCVRRRRLDNLRRSAMERLVEVEASIAALAGCDFVVLWQTRIGQADVVSSIESNTTPDTVIAIDGGSGIMNAMSAAGSGPDRRLGLQIARLLPESPLVEVVQGPKTSQLTLARGMAFLGALGRKPIAVRGDAGTLLERVLCACISSFESMLCEGVDYVRIDRAMQDAGWSAGPASLVDSVGVESVLEMMILFRRYPHEGAEPVEPTPARLLKGAGRLGCVNGLGYYRYHQTPGRRMQKVEDQSVRELLKSCVGTLREVTDDEIVARLEASMGDELTRCLRQGVVDSPQAADMAMVWGMGLPRYAGSMLRDAPSKLKPATTG